MAFFFPDFDPIAFSIGDYFSVKWYAMAYLSTILFMVFYSKMADFSGYLKEDCVMEDVVFYITLGIILGGRIGYILFYGLDYYLLNPLDVFKIWNGGMSFHGGILGLMWGIYFSSRKKKDLSFFYIADIVSSGAPIGLFLGRMANFINAELFGRETDNYWGVIISPHNMIVRHPSQIYEAFLEGMLLYFILTSLLFLTDISKYRGMLSGLFFVLYGICRIFAEIFRQPDAEIGFILEYLTLGQILSFPMILIGLIMIYQSGVFRKNMM